MAVSKNNRRKKHKRTQNHSAPVNVQRTAEEQMVNEEKKAKDRKQLAVSIFAIVIILVGLFLAWRGNRFIGYPITFAGGLIDVICARRQGKQKRLTVISFSFYCILVAYLWIFEFLVK